MTILAESTKQVFWLVRISWGDPNSPFVWRLTDANEDLQTDFGLFHGTPELQVEAQTFTGAFERKLWSFSVPVAGSHQVFLDSLGNGRAHSPITLSAWEWALGEVSPGVVQILKHMEGRVTSVTRNPDGIEGMAKFEVTTIKNEIGRAMGMPANPSCGWTFGDPKTCALPHFESLKQAAHLTAVDGLTVTITGLSAQVDRYWHRGYIEKDGVRILIKQWLQGTDFVLSQFIPTEWEEALTVTPFYVVVVVAPGCDKTLPTCQRWGQVSESAFLGIAIPAYNPSLGTGG